MRIHIEFDALDVDGRRAKKKVILSGLTSWECNKLKKEIDWLHVIATSSDSITAETREEPDRITKRVRDVLMQG